jgi:formylglycine-generating enzyme required for sulfatase activity
MSINSIRKNIETLQAQIDELQKQLQEAAVEYIEPDMVEIPNRNYSMAASPITNKEYWKFDPDHDHNANPDAPVVNVSWYDAQEYITWLNSKTGKAYRLPSEDEWQYCCADHQEASPEIAVYDADEISAVKTKKPNSFGLYDMLGNVWEWMSS